jgi:ribosomal protein S18 acetylase RimI-like enzyme
LTINDIKGKRKMTQSNIRPLVAADLPAIKALIDATGLFPSDLLDDMTRDYLALPDGPDIWLTVDLAGPIGVAYLAPERMTDGTWNLYLIAVDPGAQGRGHGTAILRHVEALLAARRQRILLVETSGLPEFAATRGFYRANGYDAEGRIRDFYAAGEDKVIFRRALI